MWDFLLKTYFGGIICIIIGVFAIWVVKKSPEMAKSAFRGDVDGWIAGIGFIVLGIGIILVRLYNDLMLLLK